MLLILRLKLLTVARPTGGLEIPHTLTLLIPIVARPTGGLESSELQ